MLPIQRRPAWVLCDVMVQQAAQTAVLGGAAIAEGDHAGRRYSSGRVFEWFPNDTRVMTVKIPGSTVKSYSM